MAIIKCPDCGKEVSDRAQACVHCGCPLEDEVRRLGEEKWKTEQEKHIADSQYDEQYYTNLLIKSTQGSIIDFDRIESIASIIEKYSPENLQVKIYRWALESGKNDEDIIDIFSINSEYTDFKLRVGELSGKKCIKRNDVPLYSALSKKYIRQEFSGYISNTIGDRLEADMLVFPTVDLETVKRDIDLSLMYMEATKKSNAFKVKIGKFATPVFRVDDLIFWDKTMVEKLTLDTVQVAKNQIDALAAQLMIDPTIKTTKKTASVGTGAAIGAAIAGVPGAIVGAAVANEKRNDYYATIERNKRVLAQREEYDRQRKASLERLNDKPMKMGTVPRYRFSIRTYVTELWFCIDGDEDIEFTYKDKTMSVREFADLVENTPKDIRTKMRTKFYETSDYEQAKKIEDDYYVECNRIKNEERKEKEYQDAIKKLTTSISKEHIQEVKNIFARLGDYKDSPQKVIEANELYKDSIYTNTIRELEMIDNIVSYGQKQQKCKECIKQLELVKDYKDSDTYIEKFEYKLQDLIIQEQKLELKKKRKRIIISASIIIVIAIISAIYINNSIKIKNERIKAEYDNNMIAYNSAVEYYNNGDYYEAVKIFKDLGSFKDSKEMYDNTIDLIKLAFEDAIKNQEYYKAVKIVKWGVLDPEEYSLERIEQEKASLKNKLN